MKVRNFACTKLKEFGFMYLSITCFGLKPRSALKVPSHKWILKSCLRLFVIQNISEVNEIHIRKVTCCEKSIRDQMQTGMYIWRTVSESTLYNVCTIWKGRYQSQDMFAWDLNVLQQMCVNCLNILLNT